MEGWWDGSRGESQGVEKSEAEVGRGQQEGGEVEGGGWLSSRSGLSPIAPSSLRSIVGSRFGILYIAHCTTHHTPTHHHTTCHLIIASAPLLLCTSSLHPPSPQPLSTHIAP